MGKLDDVLMKGANVAMRSYNWTTGGTKKQVFHQLQNAAPIFEVTGIALLNPVVGVIALPTFTFISHHQQTQGKEVCEREESALKNEMLDPISENFKNNDAKNTGFMYVIIGSAFGCMSPPALEDLSSKLGYLAVSTGFVVRGASYYIIRTDNLPPRKNCLKRGMDKLSELVQQYRPQPKLQPSMRGLYE